VSKLDDVVAVVYGSRGGNIFTYDAQETADAVESYTGMGQTAYVFWKAPVSDPALENLTLAEFKELWD
jgi:hypothetical protein